MRGRYGLCILLAATLLVGCAHKTPEQKAEAKAHKQAVAQAKADRKAAEKQAKAQAKAEKKRLAEEQDRAEAQAKAAKKQAEAQAKADKKRTEQQREQAAAQAKADQERVAAQARAEQQRAAEQARVERMNAAAAERAAKEQADHEAFAQRQQSQLAMADKAAKDADKKAKKSKKPAKVKHEKVKPYPDDEQWVVGDPYFHPENHTRLFDRQAEAMAAAGAADDATLYEKHFDGGELNALGRTKVALMLEAAPKNQPLTIYVPTTGSDERVQARLTAVNKFWQDSQYAAVQMQAKQGINPNNSTPAGQGLAALKRLEKEAQSGTGNSGGGVSASGGPGASSGGSSGGTTR
jgi:hypothetical protein